MHIFNELTYINNSSLALGFFDGLHLGHRVVLKNAINIAKRNKTQSCVIIFKEHPLNILSTEKTLQILTLDEKLEMLNHIGIDNVILLNFEEYSHIKAENYLKDFLIKYFSPIAITTGFNHFFGYKKEGNSEFLRKNTERFGYKYFEVPPFVIDDRLVSCTTIRNEISLGNFISANKMLGYNFFLKGCVIEGDKIARQLGFPSANIYYNDEKIKIPFGVYFVKVKINEDEYNGILNYGFSPTFENGEKPKTEVHILNFNRNIYGETIKISFITKIRDQIKFENKEKLIYQLKRDAAFVEIYSHFIKKM